MTTGLRFESLWAFTAQFSALREEHHGPIVNKRDAGPIVRAAQFRSGVSWAAIAQAIGKDPVWVVAALLGQHALTAADAEIVGGVAGFGSGGPGGPADAALPRFLRFAGAIRPDDIPAV